MMSKTVKNHLILSEFRMIWQEIILGLKQIEANVKSSINTNRIIIMAKKPTNNKQ